jgi:hypothetical protein
MSLGLVPVIKHEIEEPIKVVEEEVEPPLPVPPKEEALPEVLETEEDIVKYIHIVFGEAGDEAERVARCESGLRPDAQNSHSTAAGIFQIIKGTWFGNTDIPYEERYLARKNIEVAHNLYLSRGWQPWVCQP